MYFPDICHHTSTPKDIKITRYVVKQTYRFSKEEPFLWNEFVLVQLQCSRKVGVKELLFDGRLEISNNYNYFPLLLKDLICCLYNPYLRDGGSVSLIKTCTNCIIVENKSKLSQLTRADFLTIAKLTH